MTNSSVTELRLFRPSTYSLVRRWGRSLPLRRLRPRCRRMPSAARPRPRPQGPSDLSLLDLSLPRQLHERRGLCLHRHPPHHTVALLLVFIVQGGGACVLIGNACDTWIGQGRHPHLLKLRWNITTQKKVCCEPMVVEVVHWKEKKPRRILSSSYQHMQPPYAKHDQYLVRPTCTLSRPCPPWPIPEYPHSSP